MLRQTIVWPRRNAVALTTLFVCLAGVTGSAAAPAADHAGSHLRVPFGVGERLTYEVLLDSHKVGTASMAVQGVEQVHGRTAYHIIYTISARARFLLYSYRVNDRFESWLDTERLVSLRYRETQGIEDDGSYKLLNTYNIFPETANYQKISIRTDRDVDRPLEMDRGVAQPLDPCSLVYFVRSNPLRESENQSYDNYFKRDQNPVSLRSDTRLVTIKAPVEVAAGRQVDAIVVHPIIQDRGMFSKSASAQIWFSDDARYLPMQIAFREKVGPVAIHVSLRLISYTSPQN